MSDLNEGKRKSASMHARKRRTREGKLTGAVIGHLLRTRARLDEAQGLGEIAEALDAPYSTVSATIRRLEDRGVVRHPYVVDAFQTRFCHEFHVAFLVDGREIAKADPRRRKRLATTGDAAARTGGLLERFIEEIREGMARRQQYREHLILADAVILHGSRDRDVEIHVLTDDGSYTLGLWVRNELAGNPCIRSIQTVTVGFRYSSNGYSGHRVDRGNGGLEGGREIAV